MTLPAHDHVVRISTKASTVHKATGKPLPAAFEFRMKDDNWKEMSLSVSWMEFLHKGEADIPAKLDTLRRFQIDNPLNLKSVTLDKRCVYAVLNAGVIQAAKLEDLGTTLDCQHEPAVCGDPHSGIKPNPGVDHWPATKDAPAHLAIQQFLYEAICHFEPVIPPK